jgi:hypothetical protein
MELNEMKTHFKAIQTDQFKLLAFKEKQEASSFVEKTQDFHFLFLYNQLYKIEFFFSFNEEKKCFICSFTTFPSKTAEDLYQLSKYLDVLFDVLLKTGFSKYRLKKVLHDYTVIKRNTYVLPVFYEKKWTKEDIFSHQDALENLINQVWSKPSAITTTIPTFTVIGEAGRYVKELLCDEMHIMREANKLNQASTDIYTLELDPVHFGDNDVKKITYAIKSYLQTLDLPLY